MTPEWGALLGLFVFVVTLAYNAGVASNRVTALENWRTELRNDLNHWRDEVHNDMKHGFQRVENLIRLGEEGEDDKR